MKLFTYLTGAALALGVVGCKNESTSSNQPGRTPGDRAADATRDGVNATTQGAANAGNAVAGAAKDAGAAVSEAGRDAKDVAKDAKDAVVAGFSPSGASDVTGMRGTLEGVVQQALNANDLDKLTGHLVDADKQRLTGLDPKSLTAGVDQFKKAWGQKYGGDVFAVMAADQVFSDQFVTLESSGQTTADDKGKTGRATIKASHGLPQVQIPMVAQDGKWRLDLPDQVDAATLQQNLQKAVQELNAASAQWPADKVQASQHVAHRILMAVTNTQAK